MAKPRCLSACDPFELLLRLAGARLRLAELGIFLRRREHRDRLPAPDIAAIVEIEPDDALGHRRGERHLLVGERGADRVDPLDEAHRRGGLGLDQGRWTVALFARAAATGGNKCEQSQR